MQTLLQRNRQGAINSQEAKSPTVVIVGNGPVGVRCCNLILDKLPVARVRIFGEENSAPYNRVRLSDYLSGAIDQSQLQNPILHSGPRLATHWGARITKIDPQLKQVTDDAGNCWSYDHLIIATGARARWPDWMNTNRLQHPDGLLVFRTLEDAETIKSWQQKYKRLVVVGSGALGVETAHALKVPGNQVTLILGRQLVDQSFDAKAQQILRDHLRARGVSLLQKEIHGIEGEARVKAITTRDGHRIDCDCVIFCIGIEPNTALAESAGIAADRGILVDSFGRTSQPDIYAVGECSQCENKTFGLVTPGYIQAQACVLDLSRRLSRPSEETPTGRQQTTPTIAQADWRVSENWHKAHYPLSVKLRGFNALQFGQTDGNCDTSLVFVNELRGVYRKLYLTKGRLIGATIIGPCDEQNELKIAIDTQRTLRTKALRQFKETGRLFAEEQQAKELPDDYIVCLCEGVSKRQITDAIATGCRNLESLGESLRAGVNCGSCKPLIGELLDVPASNLVMRHQKAIFAISLISILAIFLFVIADPIPLAASFQVNWYLEKLWFDNFWKQVSGYTLLGMCLVATALTVRKRFKHFKLGHLDEWRFAHSIVGFLSVLMLLVHTGGRLGHNLNLILMLVFIAAVTTGSLVGVFMTRNHHWSDQKLRAHRLWWSRLHHTLLWSLPPLLLFHVLSAYYF